MSRLLRAPAVGPGERGLLSRAYEQLQGAPALIDPSDAGVGQRRERRTERQTGRMPIMGMCKSGGWHSILVAIAALFVLAVAEPVLVSAPQAQAQSGAIREIRVVGNRRVEPETVRSYL